VPFFIDEIFGWPAAAGKQLPKFVIAVYHDGIGEPEFPHTALDVGLVLSKSELGCMYANDREAFVAIAVVPGFHVGQSTNAIDASVVPEVHQHGAAPKLAEAQRR